MPSSDPSSPRPFEPDELLRHASWLHALARTLVGEADAADVVQETWVAAIAKPPGRLHSLRAWLGAVARNVVRQQARAEIRRHERETASAPSESQPSAAEVVARAAQMRDLVERVLALDEPFRATLLLRFFEGVKPQEIARRVGASEEAVRQRLKRGLDRLRAQLDAEHGGRRDDWIAGLAPLLAVPVGAAGAGVASGSATATGVAWKGVLVDASAKWGIAGGAIVVAAAVVFFATRPPPSTATVATNQDRSPPRAAAPAAASPSAVARPAVALDGKTTGPAPTTPAPTLPQNSDEPVHFVYGAVVDPEGNPVDDVFLRLHRADGIDDRGEPGAADLDDRSFRGCFAAAGLTPGPWSITATRNGFVTCRREFTIDPAAEGKRVDLVLRKALALPVQLRSTDGRPLAEAMEPEAKEGLLMNVRVLGRPSNPPDRFPPDFDASFTNDDSCRWIPRGGTAFNLAGGNEVPVPPGSDGVVVAKGVAPICLAAVFRNVTLDSAEIVDPAQPVVLTVDPDSIRSASARLKVRLVDARTKRAIAPTMVMRSGRTWGGPSRPATDRSGLTTLPAFLPGVMEFQFIASGYQRLRIPLAVDAGADIDLGTIELSPPVEVEGRAVRWDGKPFKGGVACRDLDHDGARSRDDGGPVVRADGSFVLSGLGRGRYAVVASAPDAAPAALVVDTRSNSLPPLELVLVSGTPVTFRATKPLPFQPPLCVLERDDGAIVRSAGFASEARLAPGRYRFSAHYGDATVASVPFEVGASPVTVTIPPIPDPSGLFVEEESTATATPPEAEIATNLVGDPIGIVCYGRVRAEGARQWKGGGVTFSTRSNLRGGASLHDGCFAVAGLDPGQVEREVRDPDFLPFIDWIELAAAPRLQRRDVESLPGSRIAIELFDASTGQPIERYPDEVRSGISVPGLGVVATKEPPPSEVSVRDGDSNYELDFGAGRFRWSSENRLLHGGVLRVVEPFPVHVSLESGGRVLHTELVTAPVEKLRLPVDWNAVRATLGGIRFRLVDAETGARLAASRISWLEVSMGGGFAASETLVPFDEGDGYLRKNLPPGEHKLYVVVPDHETIDDVLVLPPGQITDLGTIALARPRKLRVRVVDPDGRPVEASVSVLDENRSEAPVDMRSTHYDRTRESGPCELLLGHDAVRIFVKDERFASTCADFDPAADPREEIVVALKTGSPVVIHRVPRDVPRERIRVLDDQGHLVTQQSVTVGAARLRLAPGTYTATATVLGKEVASSRFEVASEPVAVELRDR